uniref:Uncharacterized protein n=1 Tax=Romanomermis culicivorax TaxID=13658 RepID=A0A915KHC3_ROMCU
MDGPEEGGYPLWSEKITKNSQLEKYFTPKYIWVGFWIWLWSAKCLNLALTTGMGKNDQWMDNGRSSWFNINFE